MKHEEFSPLYPGDTPEAQRLSERVQLVVYSLALIMVGTPIAFVASEVIDLASKPALGISGQQICETVLKVAAYCTQ